jgi:4-hydroxy-4-methyl-2-oxoglutarate aldolase
MDRATDGQTADGWSVGNRIRTQWERPSAELIEHFRSFPTGVIGDAMSRLGAMSGHIRPLWSGAALLGTVLPVWVRSGDNLRIHQAMQVALPAAINQGITGLVIDGAVRDIARLESLRFPVFGRGVCPAGPSKEGTREIGNPVACGGVVCSAGDLIIGDADGVVVIPFADVETVLERSRGIAQMEDEWRAGLSQGEPMRISRTCVPK